jgi:hypothetical protein
MRIGEHQDREGLTARVDAAVLLRKWHAQDAGIQKRLDQFARKTLLRVALLG